MEDGDTGFDDGSAQVRNTRDPCQPTASDHQEHMTTHRPYRLWWKFCVMGRGVNSPHMRSDAQDDLEGVRHVSIDCGFLEERESEEQVTPALVIRERRHKMTWTMLIPRKRNGISPGLQTEQRSSSTSLGTIESRSGAITTTRLGHWRGGALARKIEQSRQEGSQTVPERPRVDGIFERAVGLVASQARMGPESRPTQGCYAGWWILLRT